MIRIIHLSDFHLNVKTLKDWKNYVRTALIDKLHVLDRKVPVDFVAFTGDLIDLGGKEFKNAQIAFDIFKTEVIDPINNELGLPIEKFLIIPGNHDVVRDLDLKRIELGNVSYFNEGHNNISDFMTNAIKNSDYSGMERIRPFKEFEQKIYKEITSAKLTIFGSSFKLTSKGSSIGVCCLNSAWRCYDKNDLGRLIIGEEQLIDGLDFIKDCNVKIALSHHPMDWLLDAERGIIANHIAKDFDVLLLGHMHENKTSIQTGFTGTLFINLAPSGLNDIRSDSRTYSNGFTVIDFNKSQKEIGCLYFRYNHDQKKFVLNTDLGEDGEFKRPIPSQKSKKKITIENSCIDNIREDHFLEMDEHLMGTKADKHGVSIKEGFILPPINQGSSAENGIDEISDLTLAEIIKSRSNLMFFGDQESGKTTLLYRIAREFVDEFSYIRKIPVYINFEELGNKTFNTAIKDYLRCSSEDAKTLLEEERLVLLLDNLNFRKGINADQLNKLHKLNREFENTRIISTSENLTSGILPTDYIELCKIPFRNFFIRNLRAKEIKYLIKQWLPKESELNSDLRLDKLINSFNSYVLPSSAMSVSLFLWSMEYPERKPINHAVLMEIYIEILLQKLGKHNVYRESFDFTNKVQLLSKIAQEMLQSAEPNYSILFSSFQSIVEKYLSEEVGFDFDANIIVNYFIDRKLFVKHQQNRIRFKYSCFFHFFLAKRMIFSKTLREFIMKEDEYYKYPKEIDYYTGLTRSDEELFVEILNRFEREFKKTDFIYDDVDFDEYFTRQTGRPAKPYESIAKDVNDHQIKANRPSQKKMEAFYDQRLAQIEDPGKILRKDGAISLETLLIIMANVLRNSEGVENKALKEKAYAMQVKYSLVWMILYREYLINYIIDNKRLPPSIPNNINFEHFLRNLPLSVQGGMSKHLATSKLTPIVLNKMKEDMNSNTKSNLETFLSVALYADIQGNEFPKYLKSFAKKIGKNVVRDYLFYKILYYYYMRTRPGSPNEDTYLDILAELRIRSQKMPQRMKQRVIKQISDMKKSFDND